MKFFLHNDLPRKVARALNCLAEPTRQVVHLKERFPADTTDIARMNALAEDPDWIILSADNVISRNPHEVEAWKRAGHPIFFFKRSWNQKIFWEQASRPCHLFPEIAKRAEKGGDSFLVPFKGRLRSHPAAA